MNKEFKKSKIMFIAAAILVLAILILGALYLRQNFADEAEKGLLVSGADSSLDGVKEAGILGEQNTVAGDFETYRHPSLGFSFQYPKGFRINEFPGEGETILVENLSAGSEHKEGFQIYISSFDETGPLTFERIRKEMPDLVVEEPQTVTLKSTSDVGATSDVITALVFFGQDQSLGKTREAWFVWPNSPEPNGNYLYQITAYASFDAELSKIMATWKFAP